MQLSVASSSPEINSAAPASPSAAAAADRAALASTAAGTDGETGGGDFAALVSQFSSSSAAPAALDPTGVAGQKPGPAKAGSTPWGGGSRRAGFDFGRPPPRSASKANDALDPLTALALAGVLPTAPAQTDNAVPTLDLPAVPSPGVPNGETEAGDLATGPAMGAGEAPQAAPAGLAAADLLPSAPAAGEKLTAAGFSLSDAKPSQPDKTGTVERANGEARSASVAVAANPVAGQGEKIAEAGGPFDRESNSRERGADKKIQNALDKRVAEHQFSFGTDVAKPAPAMSIASNSRQASPDSTSVAVTGASALQDRFAPAPESAAVTASQAHRAVEAVLTAADRVGTGEKQAVNLQFSFLDVSLAVRVELREGAVHTTFRTDSIELRSALAHEWQSVSGQASDRPIKMADPVFAGSHGGSSSSSFAGDNARQQQQQQQQRDSLARSGLDFLSAAASRPGARSSVPAAADAATPTGRARRSTTTHLETFA